MDYKTMIMEQIVRYLIPVIAGLMILLGGICIRYVLKLIQSYFKFDFLVNVDERIRLVTLALKETTVKEIKEKASDGKLTKEEVNEALKNIKKNAIDEIVKQFGMKNLKWVTDIIGDPEKYISDKIEHYVYEHKIIEKPVSTESPVNPTAPVQK